MAVVKRKGCFYTYIRPFGDKKIGIRLDVSNKTEAMLPQACRTGDHTGLNSANREAAIKTFI